MKIFRRYNIAELVILSSSALAIFSRFKDYIDGNIDLAIIPFAWLIFFIYPTWAILANVGLVKNWAIVIAILSIALTLLSSGPGSGWLVISSIILLVGVLIYFK